MKTIKIASIVCALCLLGSFATATEDCKSLQGASLDGLVSYLDETSPNEGNAECVTFAIKSLGTHHYNSAIPTLVRLLDFRRQPNSHEKHHVLLHPPIIEEMFPAAAALEEIGTISERAAPAVLDAIGARSSSSTSRENAVAVWMELHKQQPTKAVKLLRKEAVGATDPAIKENLEWALSKAPRWCNSDDQDKCKAAAVVRNSKAVK